MSCPICRRKETYCLECLTGQLWPSTRYCHYRSSRRKVKAFAEGGPHPHDKLDAYLAQEGLTRLTLLTLLSLVGAQRATLPSSSSVH